MVFLTLWNNIRSRGPDQFWRKRRILRLAAHYVGRKRNCYSITIRYVHRALAIATKDRKKLQFDDRRLWETRISAGAEQHNSTMSQIREGLERAGSQLNRKVLADMSIWEPRSFEALVALGCQKYGVNKQEDTPTGQNLDYSIFMNPKEKDEEQ